MLAGSLCVAKQQLVFSKLVGAGYPVLSVRFEVGVSSLLLALAGADKRGLKAPFPPVENAGLPAEALAGAGSC